VKLFFFKYIFTVTQQKEHTEEGSGKMSDINQAKEKNRKLKRNLLTRKYMRN